MQRSDIVVTPWHTRYLGRRMAHALGRGGITRAKVEGDGATPAGVHHIAGLWFRPDRIAAHSLPRWAKPIGPGDLWSDDSTDPDYNHPVRAPHPYRHECLRRADRLYDIVLVTDWNYPQSRPGLGSAIFLHRWRAPGTPTAGCVAYAARDLLHIAQHAQPGTQLIIMGQAPFQNALDAVI